MYTHTSRNTFITLLAPLALAACAAEEAQTIEQKPVVENTQAEDAKVAATDHTVTSYARYTMHDMKAGGCMDPELTGTCNHFASKEDVYVSAGPTEGGLADGRYFFAVLVPGYQVGGFTDGMAGNLSDGFAGSTPGDDGLGDAIGNRTFIVKNHEIADYAGQHAIGISESGHKLIALGNFDDTTNPGGLYVLALCKSDGVPIPTCKYDAFVVGDQVRPHKARVSGVAYYDANTDGHMNAGEAMLADFTVKYSNGIKDNKKDAIHGEEMTALDGTFDLLVEPDEFRVWQVAPNGPWMQTGNLVNQAVMFDKTVAALNEDMSYGLSLQAASITDGVFFGNVCIGGGGAHGMDFWASMAPLTMLGPDDLAMLRDLNLRSGNGLPFDPKSAREFRDWLKDGSATNMAARLSAQLAMMALNVEHDLVDPDALVFAPDVEKANDNGFAHVQALMGEADDALALRGVVIADSPEREHQEHLMSAFEQANADKTFVQPNAMRCFELPERPL